MYDHTDFTRQRAEQTVQASLTDHVQNGLLLDADVPIILGRVKVAPSLAKAVEHAAVVFEAVLDDLALKRELFESMAAASKTALLTTNTISLSIDDIAQGKQFSVWGCRFLHPVWFISEVEVTAAPGAAADDDRLASLLKSIGITPSFYTVGNRRKLMQTRVDSYFEQQRADAAERLKRHPAQPTREERQPRGERPEAELCVVCLDQPRSALLVPCGHTTTCKDCALKLSPSICVECRQPIEKILPWSPPRATTDSGPGSAQSVKE